jgi:hypothetical protein
MPFGVLFRDDDCFDGVSAFFCVLWQRQIRTLPSFLSSSLSATTFYVFGRFIPVKVRMEYFEHIQKSQETYFKVDNITCKTAQQ